MALDPVCGMQVDEKKALSLEKDGEIYYFCSPICLKKFAEKYTIAIPASHACCSRRSLWYTNKTIDTAAIIAGIIVLSYAVPFLSSFRYSFLSYLRTIWWAILLGFFLGGIIDYYVPREYISHVLAKPKKRTILYSVLLGFLMSACSHGIIALSIELYKKGASIPAVIGFLLASPWANMTITVMLIGFFGIKAFFIIWSAILVAFITGYAYQFLDNRHLIEKNPHSIITSDDFSILNDMKKRFSLYKFSANQFNRDIVGVWQGAVSLADMVLWWILIGMGIASFAGAYIPAHVFHQFLGANFIGLIVTLVLATVIEVCSEGSAPMAFEIFRQTGALGNSFVFLMAGVATDYTEIGLLWHNIGRKTAWWLPVIAVPQIIILGIIANMLF